MKSTPFISLLLVIFFAQYSYAQNYNEQFINGDYYLIIEKSKEIEANNDFDELFHLARSYGKLAQQRNFFRIIKSIEKHKGPCEEIAFHTLISYYYQQMMFVDSSLYHVDIAMKHLRKSSCSDSLILSETYRQYANAMRNGSDYHTAIRHNNYEAYQLRNQFLKQYLDTALLYAPNDDQRGDVYHTIGTMFSDGSYQYSRREDKRFAIFGRESIPYLKKGLELEVSNVEKTRYHAIMGLNLFYIEEYVEAEKHYLKGMELTKEKGEVAYPRPFISLSDWLGMNYETRYKIEKNPQYLLKANEVYNKSVLVWNASFGKENFNDSYHNSAFSKLVNNHLDLFEISKDSLHLHKAFSFLEQSKYPDLFDKDISIKAIQEKLERNQAFVSYASVSRPWRNIAFIITENDFNVTISSGEQMSNSIAKLSNLYRFDDFENFKQNSYTYYQVYFELVDQQLFSKGISQIIVSNSDRMSMMNIDILISDTLGKTWKDLNYVFHKYKVSYALSGSSFVNQKEVDKSPLSFGVSLGEYQDEANLRFSHQLTNKLKRSYEIENQNIDDNIKQNSVNLLLSHGIGGYEHSSASVKLNSDKSLSAAEIEKMKLNNELVIFSACNTNASQRYFSQGAIGNFNKAFIKAGSKAVITTSWAIDDKANAFIIERFLHHLSMENDKSEALWLAKKDYWEQASSSEAFNPLYWAAYVLTGSIDEIFIKQTDKAASFNYYYLLILLIIPIGLFLKRRFF